MKATQKQIDYIRRLAEEAGYTGDRGYNAAEDLLADGRHWKGDIRCTSALKAKLEAQDVA